MEPASEEGTIGERGRGAVKRGNVVGMREMDLAGEKRSWQERKRGWQEKKWS